MLPRNRTQRRQLFSLLVVALCLIGIIGGPIVAAQQAPVNGSNSTNGSAQNPSFSQIGGENGTNNSTAGNVTNSTDIPIGGGNGTGNSTVGNATNGTAGNNSTTLGNGSSSGGMNGSGNASGGGAGGGGGQCGPLNPAGCIPSTEEVLSSTLDFFIGQLATAVEPILDELVKLISGMPAPGEYNRPLTWSPGISSSSPDSSASDSPGQIAADESEAGGLWNDIYEVWIVMIGLASVIFTVSGSWLFAKANPYEFRREVKSWVIALSMAILTWFTAPLGLHIGRRISLAIAPSAADLTGSFGGGMKLGLGVLVGAVIAIFQTGVIFLAVFILFLEYFLVHVVVALWPVAWALTTTRNDTLESIGSSILYMYGLLIILYVAQAILLHIGFAFDWGFSGSGIAGVFFTTIALAAALIFLPVKMVNAALNAGVIQLGVGKMGKRLRNKDSVADRWKKYRSNNDGGGGGGGGGGGSGPIGSAPNGRQYGRDYGQGGVGASRRTAADGGTPRGRNHGRAGINMTEAVAEERSSASGTDGAEPNGDAGRYSGGQDSWYAPTGSRTVSGSNREGRSGLGRAGIGAAQASAEDGTQATNAGSGGYSNIDPEKPNVPYSSIDPEMPDPPGRDDQLGRGGIEMTRSAAFDRDFEPADEQVDEAPAEEDES